MTSEKTSSPNIDGKCHPLCLLLPQLGTDEYRELVEDIRAHGQRHAIIVDEDNLILDGRHRYQAMVELGLPPNWKVFPGDESAKAALIMSENVHRRHLTVQQRAAIAAELSTKLGKAAKARQRSGVKVAPEAKGKATEQAATMVGGVSPASVARAVRTMHTDPEAHEKAKAGTLGKAKPGTKKAKPGAKYVMPDRDAKPTPSLLEALGKLVAFSPAAARRYVAEHPEEAGRIKTCVGSARGVLDALDPPAPKPEPAPEPEEPEGQDAAAPEPEGALEAVQEPGATVDLGGFADALTANLADRRRQKVSDWMGDRTQASAAKALGISLPSLRKVLAGQEVRKDVREKIMENLR